MSFNCEITVPVTISFRVPAGTDAGLVDIARTVIKSLMESCGVSEWADWANTIADNSYDEEEIQDYIQEAVEAIRQKKSPKHKCSTCKTENCAICNCDPHGLTVDEQKTVMKLMKDAVTDILP